MNDSYRVVEVFNSWILSSLFPGKANFTISSFAGYS